MQQKLTVVVCTPAALQSEWQAGMLYTMRVQEHQQGDFKLPSAKSLSFYATLWKALCCCSHEMNAAHEEVDGAVAASREKVLDTTAR